MLIRHGIKRVRISTTPSLILSLIRILHQAVKITSGYHNLVLKLICTVTRRWRQHCFKKRNLQLPLVALRETIVPKKSPRKAPKTVTYAAIVCRRNHNYPAFGKHSNKPALVWRRHGVTFVLFNRIGVVAQFFETSLVYLERVVIRLVPFNVLASRSAPARCARLGR